MGKKTTHIQTKTTNNKVLGTPAFPSANRTQGNIKSQKILEQFFNLAPSIPLESMKFNTSCRTNYQYLHSYICMPSHPSYWHIVATQHVLSMTETVFIIGVLCASLTLLNLLHQILPSCCSWWVSRCELLIESMFDFTVYPLIKIRRNFW